LPKAHRASSTAAAGRRPVRIQTGAGGELDGTVIKRKSDGFTHTIEEDFGAAHRVVPGCPNAQAEAESLHSRTEPEFFDIEEFSIVPKFLGDVGVDMRFPLGGLPAARAEGPDALRAPCRCIATSLGARVARLRCPILRTGKKILPGRPRDSQAPCQDALS